MRCSQRKPPPYAGTQGDQNCSLWSAGRASYSWHWFPLEFVPPYCMGQQPNGACEENTPAHNCRSSDPGSGLPVGEEYVEHGIASPGTHSRSGHKYDGTTACGSLALASTFLSNEFGARLFRDFAFGRTVGAEGASPNQDPDLARRILSFSAQHGDTHRAV